MLRKVTEGYRRLQKHYEFSEMKVIWQESPFIEKEHGKVNYNYNAGNNKENRIFIHKMSPFAFSYSPDIYNEGKNSTGDIKMKECHNFVLDRLDTFIARLMNTTVMAMPAINVAQGILDTAPGINMPTTSDANINFALSKKNSEIKSTQSLCSITDKSTTQLMFCQGYRMEKSKIGTAAILAEVT